MTITCNTLIVDPNAEARTRLKVAMRSVSLFRTIFTAARFEDGESVLDKEENIDVIFVPQRLGPEMISRFIKIAQSKASTRDSAIILTLEGGNTASTFVSNLMQGVDGFLIEPYSVEQLVEITGIAERVKTEHRRKRFGSALDLLVSEIEVQVGQLAALKKKNYPAAISQRIFRDMCSVLQELDGELIEDYYSTLIRVFTAVPPPSEREASSESYRGASQRVRGKVSINALEKFKETLAA